MAMATALLLFLFFMPAAYAVQYTVGDGAGWAQGVDYTAWATGKTFNVGDTLLFSYGGTHKVDVVGQTDYNNCANGNPLESYSDGNTIIPLNKTGPIYFLCPTSNHCTQGMKLAVTVSATTLTPSQPPTSPSTPSTPSPPPPPSTPSPPSSSAAAHNVLYRMNFMVLAAAIIVALVG